MVLLQSKSLALGWPCPHFSLPSVSDKSVRSLDDFKGRRALLIAFICNHCPYVRAIEDRLIALKSSFHHKDLEIVGICANDESQYPEDSPEKLKIRSQEKNYGFPYLVDSEQSVARAFDAVCTPDFFLFDDHRKLFYHGRLDDSWQDASKVLRQELREAIVAILQGKNPPADQKPSLGCSIKWKKKSEDTLKSTDK